MSILKSGEVVKLCYVGKSGTGKSSLGRLSSWALGLPLLEAGELMRVKYPDLETNPRAPQIEDDVEIDSFIRANLADPTKSFVLHGRTSRPIAQKLIEEQKLDTLDFFHVSIECLQEIRGERALSKLRKQKNDPNLTVSEAVTILNKRDRDDLIRFRVTLDVQSERDLNRTDHPLTDGLPLDSGLLTPHQELKNVLWMLSNRGKLIPGGVVMGYTRAILAENYHNFMRRVK